MLRMERAEGSGLCRCTTSRLSGYGMLLANVTYKEKIFLPRKVFFLNAGSLYHVIKTRAEAGQ